MKKFHMLLIVLLGFFLMPGMAFACGDHSEKKSCNKEAFNKEKMNCCKEETTSKTVKDDCCKNDNHSKNKNHDGCDGKCGHSKCTCPSTNTPFPSVSELNFKNNIFDFSYEKQKFYQSETFLSSGFYSLWLIPKIG